MKEKNQVVTDDVLSKEYPLTHVYLVSPHCFILSTRYEWI